jgi:hypothetical protein
MTMEPSSSPIASCLVIAPKATTPFIRFCGAYVAINYHVEVGHYPIPHGQNSLEKIIKFKIFLVFDLVQPFHNTNKCGNEWYVYIEVSSFMRKSIATSILLKKLVIDNIVCPQNPQKFLLSKACDSTPHYSKSKT